MRAPVLVQLICSFVLRLEINNALWLVHADLPNYQLPDMHIFLHNHVDRREPHRPLGMPHRPAIISAILLEPLARYGPDDGYEDAGCIQC